MRLIRVYVDQPLVTDSDLPLPEAAAYHVARVLRLRAGATLVAFDGRGHEHRCEILSVEGDRVRVRVGSRAQGLAESPLAITLVQSISRGERMDWTLQKATELGVAVIQPVLSARSVVRLDEQQARKKLRHWQAIVAGACEQCGRSVLPEVRAPQELHAFLASAPRDGQRLVLSPSGPASLAGLASLTTRVTLLIGPEGGLDDAELERAGQSGYMPVRLGPHVLRTETAGIVALTVLQALWGDLN
ncbi:MAG TPA: 16S rRNA (uracil(1498)-N(3))-methyltransferase [Steroidobacteraceae bacterium]